MSKKLYSLDVRGKEHEWSFHVMVDPQHVNEWREDGLVLHRLENIIPAWVVDANLTRLWCFLQDIFHFKNPFKNW